MTDPQDIVWRCLSCSRPIVEQQTTTDELQGVALDGSVTTPHVCLKCWEGLTVAERIEFSRRWRADAVKNEAMRALADMCDTINRRLSDGGDDGGESGQSRGPLDSLWRRPGSN